MKKVNTKKSTKVVAKANKAPVAVSAAKILKNGKPSAKAKTYSSIREAARDMVKQGLASNVNTAAANICNTSLGREKRETIHTRHEAYGFAWQRG